MMQMRIIFRILFLAGIICFLIASGFAINSILFVNKAISAEGVVVNLIEETSVVGDNNNSSVLYRPEVRFITREGEIKKFISSLASDPPRFIEGSKVNVLYYIKSGRIIRAEIDSFIILWFAPLVAFFIGLVFCIVSFFSLHSLKTGRPMGVSYNYQLKGKEILYYFNRNKLCPNCNGKLSKEKRMVDKGISLTKSSEIDGVSYMNGQRYDVKYWYKCSECGRSFPIEELIRNNL